MATPSSGALSMLGLAREKVYDQYNSSTAPSAPYSLKDLSLGGNTNGSGVSFDLTNVANLNANKPDNSAPYAMSEFYKYDHAPNLSTTPLSASHGATSSTNNIITVNLPNSSTCSSSPSFGTVSQCKYSVEANSGSTRYGDLTITLNVGTTNGAHPNGTNSTTTRTTAIEQSGSNSGGGGDDGRGFP